MAYNDFFKKAGPKVSTPEPTVSMSPSKQPEAGGPVTTYKVMGLWHLGRFTIPRSTVIELSGGRRTEKPGDTIELTRQEAAVVQKRFVLLPLED